MANPGNGTRTRRGALMDGPVLDVRDRPLAADHFAVLAAHSPDLILRLDDGGVVQQASSRSESLIGCAPGAVVGSTLESLVHPDDRSACRAAVAAGIRGTRDGARLRLTRRRGGWVWCEASLRATRHPGTGDIVDLLMTLRDVSARHEAEARLAHLVHHDALTGLPNRRLLVERLTAAVDRSRRAGQAVTLLFCDLDRFTSVNQSSGHSAGDELLQRVARRMATTLGRTDQLYRVGGDEFVAVCEDTDEPGAVSAAEILCRAIEQPFALTEQHAYVSCSVGVRVIAPSERVSLERALSEADSAMRRAKEAGGNRVVTFSTELHRRQSRRRELADGLRRAIARDELTLNFQPIVDLLDGRVLGVESLVRWEQPGGEHVRPDEFIPIAEESGLIGKIGDWVLDRAVSQAESWHWEGIELPLLAVNVSLSQLADDGFVERVRRILRSGRLGRTHLGLELTETAVLLSGEAGLARLATLRRLGVHLAVDDFGTGYSSLAHLKDFPTELLKVDQRFVAGLGHDAGDTAIVSSTVGLATALGMEVVAEGIEHRAQVAHLRTMGCRAGQGFLFGRPAPGPELGGAIRRGFADLVRSPRCPSAATATLALGKGRDGPLDAPGH